MSELILYIGNKNYSSWSFRPWIALDGCGIAFEERLIQFDFAAGNREIKAVSPSGRVPLLVHEGTKIWESLAIIEYAADLHPEAGLWPTERAARGVARSVSMEMLSGFRALRGACPMNMRRPRKAIALPEGVNEDVARIVEIWREALSKSGGPFLFGDFSAADAMYAPVVNRFDIYDLVSDGDVRAYMERMQAHPSWVKWRTAALAEPWIVEEDEA